MSGFDDTPKSFLFSTTSELTNPVDAVDDEVLERIEDGDTLGEESEYRRQGRVWILSAVSKFPFFGFSSFEIFLESMKGGGVTERWFGESRCWDLGIVVSGVKCCSGSTINEVSFCLPFIFPLFGLREGLLLGTRDTRPGRVSNPFPSALGTCKRNQRWGSLCDAILCNC